jgi:hypothetical protein
MKTTSTHINRLRFFYDLKLLLLALICIPFGIKAASYLNLSLFSPASSQVFVASFTDIRWENAANQPFSVSEAQAEVVNQKLYSFGGFDSQKACCTPTNRAFVFDPVLNTWTALANMPAMNGTSFGGVTHAGFTNDGTDIYFAGGYTSNSSGTGQIFGTTEAWK